MINLRLQTLVFATALAIMLGWLLYVGQGVILPIVAGIISAYIIWTTAESLGRLPVIKRAPSWLRHILVLLGFVLALSLMVFLLSIEAERVVAATPRYQQNLMVVITQAAQIAGFQDEPTWASIRHLTLDRINLQTLLATLAASMTNFGGQVFLVALYAAFLLAERVQFVKKLLIAMTTEEGARHALGVLGQVNHRVGAYLATKTLVNIILALASYAIMWLIGIDFAVLWAILIGLLNYIPYVGSLIGVMFPVVLAVAQFGAVGPVLVALIALTGAQVFVGSVLEPRVLGRSVNLSPFVVLVALSFWTALWGLPGAILAIPMTSIVTIVLASAGPTRPLAVMFSSNGKI